MRKKSCLFVVWLLVISLALGGCSMLPMNPAREVVFSDIAYDRPDTGALAQAADEVEAKISSGEAVESLMDSVFAFYEKYHDFYTNYALANIYYCKDITDIYWEQEYDYCLGAAAQVDSLLDNMLYALADCPLREELESDEYFGAGFFDSYEGESLWTDAFTELMEQEAALEARYYELGAEAQKVPAYSESFYKTYGVQMTDLLVELVKVRQKIAAEAGYADYLSFAYDFYYYRDYTPQQAEVLLGDIQKHLVPLYRKLPQVDVWEKGEALSSERTTFTYGKNTAAAMGGKVEEAFSAMEKGKFYDISYGPNKYDASFEMFLPSYSVPYVFVNPNGTVYDQLTFAHEFGHFCKDYAVGGSIVGIDVAEIFSQGMEYLSIVYGGGESQLKLCDGLCIYVEQAAYASFEHQLYTMEDPTAEKVFALYEQVGKEFGFDVWQWDSRSFVYILHFFTEPLYVISYVVSNDAALQLFELEKAQPGSGLEKYQESLEVEIDGYLAFLEEVGLKTPFVSGRLEKVAALLEKEIFA